jgi:hypothetical protein
MKRKSIAFRKRVIAIVSLAVLTVAGTCSLVLLGVIGVTTEKEMPAAKYRCVSEISYTPILNEGAYYNAENIEFGDYFIASYVDKLRLDCNYIFDSDNATDIEGNYSITATLLGVYSNTTVWKKEYVLDAREFTGNTIDKAFILRLSNYRNFIDEMNNETGVNPNVTVNISYQVNASAFVGGESVSETSVSTLKFSMNDTLMQFSGEPVSTIEETVNGVVTTETKLSKVQLIANIAVLALTFSSLVYILFFTAGQKPDPAQKQLDKIYKYYGSRIVELKPGTKLQTGNLIIVSSFKDLLLTADELKKPILKIGKEGYKQTSFFVIDEPRQYVFYARSLSENQSRELRKPAYSA